MTGPSSERTADADVVREALDEARESYAAWTLSAIQGGQYEARLEDVAKAHAALDRLAASNQQLQEALAYIEQRLTAPEGGHVTSSYAAAVDARERARATLASGGTPLASAPDLGGASSEGNDEGRGAAALASVRARTP